MQQDATTVGTAAGRMATHFAVRIAGDDLVFSAAHFLAIAPDQYEPLHGHNYRVAAELFGPLGKQQYVIDFAVVRQTLLGILRHLDHRVLLPSEHPALVFRQSQAEVEVAFAGRRWVFPADNCLMLPLADTTAELLARYIGCRLIEQLASHCPAAFSRLQVSVEECPGQTALCQLEPS